MGLIAFCVFVLPYFVVAVWLYATQIKPYHTGVPWRTLARYPGLGEGPTGGWPREDKLLKAIVPPLAATLPDRQEGESIH